MGPPLGAVVQTAQARPRSSSTKRAASSRSRNHCGLRRLRLWAPESQVRAQRPPPRPSGGPQCRRRRRAAPCSLPRSARVPGPCCSCFACPPLRRPTEAGAVGVRPTSPRPRRGAAWFFAPPYLGVEESPRPEGQLAEHPSHLPGSSRRGTEMSCVGAPAPFLRRAVVCLCYGPMPR